MAAGGRGASFFLPFAALNLAITSDGITALCSETLANHRFLTVAAPTGCSDHVRIEADDKMEVVMATAASGCLSPR
jgi:hypothetical protein